MTTPKTSAPTVIVDVAAPPQLLARIRDTAADLRLITQVEFKEHPGLLDQAEILFTLRGDPAAIARAPRLRWIQTLGAGVEWLLTPEVCARRELVITNVSGIHADAMAEHVFGFLAMFAHRLHVAVRRQLERRWAQDELRDEVTSLAGGTLGILGLGAIGRRIAELGVAHRMRVVGLKRSPEPAPPAERVYGPGQLPRLLAEADYVVNVLPATAETRRLIGAREFEAMRRDAIFVNVGRGTTVDTDALVAALRAGRIRGAGLDVTDPEPLPANHALWELENVILTPHYAGAHPGYVQRAAAIFIENLSRYLAGQPLTHVVDAHAGY